MSPNVLTLFHCLPILWEGTNFTQISHFSWILLILTHLLLTLQSWTKVLVTVMQYSYFSVILGSFIKQCILFEIFLQFSLPPTLYKVETRKTFWIYASNCLWGKRRSWACVNWKTPRNANVSQEFCPWLSEIEVGRKKSILSGFQACKSVFSDFSWKIVIEKTFS